MCEVLFSWIVILACSVFIGYAFMILSNRIFNSVDTYGVDFYIVIGLSGLTIYAQFVSVVYKVGIFADFILVCFCFVILLLLIYVSYKQKFANFSSCKKVSLWKILVALIIIVAMIAWTSKTADFVDTALYHAQAIRWIEEYGVVKGLGNLRNRFAYNSAFLPLQALFSFKWHFGRSLHTVNGFVCCCAVLYSLLTNNFFSGKLFSQKSVMLSDWLKLSVLPYVFFQREYISSPNTDMMALIMFWYIIVKWTELIEKKNVSTNRYVYLCILSVFTLTLKLSCAACVLLSIYPIVQYCKKKKYWAILKSICIGLIVALPWLIRNVIISGYLIYPYPQIDLFDFDWKMPASILTYDSREIMVWARDIYDVSKYNMPFWEWLPIWFSSQDMIYRIIIAISLVAFVVILIKLIKEVIYGRLSALTILYAVILLSGTIWLLTAPLIRYGMIYLFVMIAVMCDYLTLRFSKKVQISAIISYAIVIPFLFVIVGKLGSVCSENIIRQGDYLSFETQANNLDGITVYTGVEGEARTGYDSFPSTGQAGIINVIEPRGETLCSGFRVKKEYINEHIHADGNTW